MQQLPDLSSSGMLAQQQQQQQQQQTHHMQQLPDSSLSMLAQLPDLSSLNMLAQLQQQQQQQTHLTQQLPDLSSLMLARQLQYYDEEVVDLLDSAQQRHIAVGAAPAAGADAGSLPTDQQIDAAAVAHTNPAGHGFQGVQEYTLKSTGTVMWMAYWYSTALGGTMQIRGFPTPAAAAQARDRVVLALQLVGSWKGEVELNFPSTSYQGTMPDLTGLAGSQMREVLRDKLQPPTASTTEAEPEGLKVAALPPGTRLLDVDEVAPALQGSTVYYRWPDDGLWYIAQVQEVYFDKTSRLAARLTYPEYDDDDVVDLLESAQQRRIAVGAAPAAGADAGSLLTDQQIDAAAAASTNPAAHGFRGVQEYTRRSTIMWMAYWYSTALGGTMQIRGFPTPAAAAQARDRAVLALQLVGLRKGEVELNFPSTSYQGTVPDLTGLAGSQMREVLRDKLQPPTASTTEAEPEGLKVAALPPGTHTSYQGTVPDLTGAAPAAGADAGSLLTAAGADAGSPPPAAGAEAGSLLTEQQVAAAAAAGAGHTAAGEQANTAETDKWTCPFAGCGRSYHSLPALKRHCSHTGPSGHGIHLILCPKCLAPADGEIHVCMPCSMPSSAAAAAASRASVLAANAVAAAVLEAEARAEEGIMSRKRAADAAAEPSSVAFADMTAARYQQQLQQPAENSLQLQSHPGEQQPMQPTDRSAFNAARVLFSRLDSRQRDACMAVMRSTEGAALVIAAMGGANTRALAAAATRERGTSIQDAARAVMPGRRAGQPSLMPDLLAFQAELEALSLLPEDEA